MPVPSSEIQVWINLVMELKFKDMHTYTRQTKSIFFLNLINWSSLLLLWLFLYWHFLCLHFFIIPFHVLQFTCRVENLFDPYLSMQTKAMIVAHRWKHMEQTANGKLVSWNSETIRIGDLKMNSHLHSVITTCACTNHHDGKLKTNWLPAHLLWSSFSGDRNVLTNGNLPPFLC